MKQKMTNFRDDMVTRKDDYNGYTRPTSTDILKAGHMQEQVEKIKLLIGNYMSIVDTTVRDMTPKYIMLTLGNTIF